MESHKTMPSAETNSINYCCAAKKYFSSNQTLSDTLEILPRTVIFKKSLKATDIYEQMITIKNDGLFSRRLEFFTDSAKDTTIRLCTGIEGNYLEPGDIKRINIRICPVEKKKINRRRAIFIRSFHPNVIFEVPVIIVLGNPTVSIPSSITFPQSVPGTISNYEFIMYNPLPKPCPVIVKSMICLVTFSISANTIPAKDYVKVLLCLDVRSLQPRADIIKVKVDNTAYKSITWTHQPISRSLYLSVSELNFDQLTFGRQDEKKFDLCNESRDPINYQSQLYPHENPAKKDEVKDALWISIDAQESIDSIQIIEDIVETTNVSNTLNHFSLDRPEGVIEPNSSCSIILIFNPIESECDFPTEQNPPFKLQAEVHFSLAACNTAMQSSFLVVTAYVKAPKVQFKSTVVELRPFIGEEHCELTSVKNLDEITSAIVTYQGYDGELVAHVDVLPIQKFILKPLQEHSFMVHMYTLVVGKFQVKLHFKVKNGHNHSLIMTGISRSIRMRVFPDIIELGSIPFAVPQKKSILVMNPLIVPIVISCKPADDGVEQPLVLNPYNVNESMPVNVRDEFNHLTKKIDRFCSCDSLMDDSESIRSQSSYVGTARSYQSMQDDHSSVSTAFEEAILNNITKYSQEVLTNFKTNRLIEKTAVEERTVREAMQVLMQSPYFAKVTDHQNYAYMDWNALPSDPQELYCGDENIYLSPNTGKNITVLVIPNKVGYFNRSLDVQCCPFTGSISCGPVGDTECYVASENLSSKIYIEYHCRLPDINWIRKIVLDNDIIYAGQDYDFDMCFENMGSVGGFIHYTVVPDCADGVMTFRDKNWKFFIGPESSYFVNCGVFFRRSGAIKLSGLLKIVGQTLPEPYHILADMVLPPRVRIQPKTIVCKQKVMVKSHHYIYIENATPTRTQISMDLKFENNQSVYPQGFILGPSNHGMYVVLETKFTDPDTYKNTLQLRVQYGQTWEIPITFHIGDMPIFFNPPIRDSYDLGPILVSSQEDFMANVSNCTRIIRVYNEGKRSYRLITSKLRNSLNQNAGHKSMTRLLVMPKVIHIRPNQEELIHITTIGCEASQLYNEYRIQIMDTTNVQRFKNLRLVITGRLIQPDVQWSRKEIVMNFDHSNKHHQAPFELVHIYNPSEAHIDRLQLRVEGPFYLRELYEDPALLEVAFELPGLTSKEMMIVLNRATLDNSCSEVHGRLYCTANNIAQKSLPLRVNILRAQLQLSSNHLTLFVKHREGHYHFELKNIGCLDAHFKWKKLRRQMNYIAMYDDSRDFAQELLSDVLLDLDLSDEFTDVDSIYEKNMTLRYQKYRCYMRRIEDTAGAVGLLDGIIDSLDLQQKRYKLVAGWDEKDVTEMNKTESVLGRQSHSELHQSPYSFVCQILDQIVGGLKLEDSSQRSEISLPPCPLNRALYFYEKTGTIKPNESVKCRLHLPPVRKGYALSATFECNVCGGPTETLLVTLANLRKPVQLSKDKINIGVKPWYEAYKIGLRTLSVTEFHTSTQIQELPPVNAEETVNRVAGGFVRLLTPQEFQMNPFASRLIRFEGILGFCSEFQRHFKFIINESEELFLRMRGQGAMPMVTIVDRSLPYMKQTDQEIIHEYKLLQRIYQFEMFKDITAVDTEFPLAIGEETEDEFGENGIQNKSLNNSVEVMSSSTNSTLEDALSISSDEAARREAREKAHETSFEALLATYERFEHSSEWPDELLLKQIIATESFLDHVALWEDIKAQLLSVYYSYLRQMRTCNEKVAFSLKHFTVQPIPCHIHGYVLQMGQLSMGRKHNFAFTLQLIGPGRLIVAARTSIKIHGLNVNFVVDDTDQLPKRASSGDKATPYSKYITYQLRDTSPDYYDKHYRNIYERALDYELDMRLKCGHSFDCKDYWCGLHERIPHKFTAAEIQSVHNYYSSLKRSVYLDQKYHTIHAKLFTKSHQNVTGTQLRVNLEFIPTAKFYSRGQLVEDFLYIDLHLGPSLPVLLKGRFPE